MLTWILIWHRNLSVIEYYQAYDHNKFYVVVCTEKKLKVLFFRSNCTFFLLNVLPLAKYIKMREVSNKHAQLVFSV